MVRRVGAAIDKAEAWRDDGTDWNLAKLERLEPESNGDLELFCSVLRRRAGRSSVAR